MPAPKKVKLHTQYGAALIGKATEYILPWEVFGITFPKTEPGVRILAITLLDLCGTGTRTDGTDNWEVAAEFSAWVSKFMPDHRCPSPYDMRQIFCQRWKPADGIENNDPDLDLSDIVSRSGQRKVD